MGGAGGAIGAAAKHGFELFTGKAGCARRHAPGKDLGRCEVTPRPEDTWRFKTPSLGNVALTAPCMHDGSLLTLHEAVYLYVRGGVEHPGRDPATAKKPQ